MRHQVSPLKYNRHFLGKSEKKKLSQKESVENKKKKTVSSVTSFGRRVELWLILGVKTCETHQ